MIFLIIHALFIMRIIWLKYVVNVQVFDLASLKLREGAAWFSMCSLCLICGANNCDWLN